MGAPVTIVNADGTPGSLVATIAGPLVAGSATIGNVGLVAGTAAIGTLTGDSYAHITTATTTTVKASPGVVKAVIINTKGTVASVTTVKDNATTIAIIDSLTLSGTFTLNVACATSIVVVTTGTVAPDVTVTFQ